MPKRRGKPTANCHSCWFGKRKCEEHPNTVRCLPCNKYNNKGGSVNHYQPLYPFESLCKHLCRELDPGPGFLPHGTGQVYILRLQIPNADRGSFDTSVPVQELFSCTDFTILDDAICQHFSVGLRPGGEDSHQLKRATICGGYLRLLMSLAVINEKQTAAEGDPLLTQPDNFLRFRALYLLTGRCGYLIHETMKDIRLEDRSNQPRSISDSNYSAAFVLLSDISAFRIRIKRKSDLGETELVMASSFNQWLDIIEQELISRHAQCCGSVSAVRGICLKELGLKYERSLTLDIELQQIKISRFNHEATRDTGTDSAMDFTGMEQLDTGPSSQPFSQPSSDEPLTFEHNSGSEFTEFLFSSSNMLNIDVATVPYLLPTKLEPPITPVPLSQNESFPTSFLDLLSDEDLYAMTERHQPNDLSSYHDADIDASAVEYFSFPDYSCGLDPNHL